MYMIDNNRFLLLSNIRIQDILDIVIISIMISALLIWFKDRASRFVLAGIGLIGLVYLLALFFGLYLTTVVLQSFFAIFLFLLVVIFQEDLRRFFERLAVWGRIKKDIRSKVSADRQSAEIIAQSVANLLKKRIGALIVIAGKDPLERHLSGGTIVNGQLSQALIESIFDPSSPGHDGAVVIEGSRVIQFGCHLPLASSTGDYGNLGLRHTAALGLAERSDAVCVVVSEERGTISLASGEELREIKNASALGAVIESFYAEKAPKREKRPVFSFLRENQREKLIALILACLLWFVFGYQREIIRRDFTVPIDYKNISAQWFLDLPKISEAKVTLAGPAQAFHLLDPAALNISVDLSQLRSGTNEIIIKKNMLNIPANLTVSAISPGLIRLSAYHLTYVSVPVEVVTENTPPAPYVVERISVAPARIMLKAPMNYQAGQLKIQTETINLRNLTATRIIVPRLVLPPGVVFETGKPPAVKVTVKIGKRRR